MDAHRRIIPIDELVHDVLESEVVDASDLADDDVKAAIERKIDGVTRAIEGFLNRELVIKQQVVRAQTGAGIGASDWEYAEDLAVYELLSPYYPVVSIISPSGVTVVDGDLETIKVTSPFAGAVRLLAGFRRQDQPTTGLEWVGIVNDLASATAIGNISGSVSAGEVSTITLDAAADYADEEWLAITDDSDVPVVTVQVDGGQSAVATVDVIDRTVPALSATNRVYRITYGGGIDQDGSDPDLELLPDDIRDVAVEILVHELTARNENAFGRTKTSNIGQAQISVQRTDKQFRETMLQRIYHHRRVVA